MGSGQLMGAPQPPPGFIADTPVVTPRPLRMFGARPTGDVHDGDTFRLDTGDNARLFGVDAFELKQQGLTRNGPMPIGRDARDFLHANIATDSVVGDTGSRSYHRPVTTLTTGGNDVGLSILRNGWGMATPQYLRDDPTRLTDYMEAERLARLNRLGAHAGQFQNPADYRHKVPSPWAEAQPGKEGESTAVFWDEPTPFQGLRKDIADGYIALSSDPKSTASDLLAYARKNGFEISSKDAEEFITKRQKAGGQVQRVVTYKAAPQVITDNGDGALGSVLRGLADPINMLDEIGGVVDTLGGTPGRENLWNSDRRFGDVLWNNIDQNRSILAYDDAEHPYARFGGQLAGGLVLPGASVNGVGFRAVSSALRGGATRFAAVDAAKAAVRRRLALSGSVEGGLAGFGAAEGDPIDRLPRTVVGAVTGAGLGYGSGALAQTGGPLVAKGWNRLRGRGAVSDSVGINAPEPPPGFVRDAPQTISMANETPQSILQEPRVVDRIDINARPRPLLDPATNMERMRQAQGVRPPDVLPILANEVQSMDEAARIGSGLYPEIKAPDESRVLQSRSIPSPADASKTVPKRGPLDLVTFLRSKGGIGDAGGDLRHSGIDNTPRDLDFAKGEQRFGRLVDNERGMSLDDAARTAWEAGYFPDHTERPTIREFLDAVDNTHRGINRSFRPEDHGEVDAFERARKGRYAVEKAAQEGAPLVEDRGQPVTLADLEANQPPVSAYEEWPDGGPDLAGNIRLDHLDSPQNIKRALAVTDQRVGGFDAARRGRITQAETQNLANELGMTPDQLLSRRKGQAFNAEEALAARQILAKSGNELVNLAKRVQRMDDPGEEVLAAFRQAWVRHAAIQEQIAGATAEAGRALAQFRMTADSANVHGNVLASIVQGAGGPQRLKDAADLILEHSDNPAILNRDALQALKPRFRDKLVELWYNSLLSGPQTHVVNIVSNTMTALGQVPEHMVAAGIGGVRNAASRSKINDRVLFTELGARSFGLLQGVREGLRQAARTMRTGEASDFASKVEAQSDNAISGLKGKVIRTPTRMLSAEDELFKAMARRMELAGLAVRHARGEGLTGEAAKKRVADLVANPTDDMLEKAFDYGRYLTFQRPLGPVMRHVSAMTQNMPVLKLILPFVRTPANLLKFSLERSPAAPLLKEWRMDVKAGGARRDLALARASVGTAVGALVMEMAANGQITGNGPADDDAKHLLRADGWQPYSVKIGERYYSYQRLDPFSTTLGISADMVDLQQYMTEKQKEKVAFLVTAAVMRNLTSKTWLSGISDLTEAINDPERSASGFLKRLSGSLAVPTGVAQVARTMDPTLREAEGILDQVRSRIPVVSRDLTPQRDVWGQPIVNEGGAGPNLLSPFWTSTRKNDPVNNALLENGIHIGTPQREVGGVRLTLPQFGQYREMVGQEGRAGIGDLIRQPDWQAMAPDERKDAVDKIMRDARSSAKGRMFGGSRATPPPPPPQGYSMDAPPAGYVLDK